MPEMIVAWIRSFACAPPFSPVTRTSVIAVASGNGNCPCISFTKYRRSGMMKRIPRHPPARQMKIVCAQCGWSLSV